MGDWRKFPIGQGQTFGRILNRPMFLFILDVEVKRARRYQNFLCLIVFRIRSFSEERNREGLEACRRALGDLLSVEMRESDIIGSLEWDKVVVLLPYADMKTGGHVKSRFEEALKYYDFKEKGFEIMVEQSCFPIDGTDMSDLIRKAQDGESA